ncbi:hypothetical protein ACUN0C_18660 [Faunimonas sp. B44]|uniref:hypothetical protein n=1 Tax=Faunimonas sp. B44 TaxID=3461493 RepID=UPI004043D430
MNRFLATTLPFAFAWSKLPNVDWSKYTPYPNTPLPYLDKAEAERWIYKITCELPHDEAIYLSENWRKVIDLPKSTRDYAEKLEALGFYEIGSGCYSKIYKRIGSERVVKVCLEGDPGIEYLIWAHENGWAGNWAPKIYSARRFANGSYIAVIEHLETVVAHVPKYRNMIDRIQNPFMEAFRERFQDYSWDLHTHNWMVRRTGQLVLVDPLSGKGTTTNKFEKLRFAA